MSTITAGRSTTSSGFAVARAIRMIAGLVAALIVIGILLVVLGARPSNDIVNALTDAARWLAGPFKGIFNPGGHKLDVAVNWGLAAVVYSAIGHLIARLVAR